MPSLDRPNRKPVSPIAAIEDLKRDQRRRLQIAAARDRNADSAEQISEEDPVLSREADDQTEPDYDPAA